MDTNMQPSADVMIRAIKRSILEVNTTGCDVVETLDHATAFVSARRPRVYDANFAGDVRLEGGTSAEQVWQEVTAFFAAHDSRCRVWHARDPVFPPDLAELLTARGGQRQTQVVLRLRDYRAPSKLRDDLQIVNARAVRSEYREFRFLQNSAKYGREVGEDLADFGLDALDEPRLDMMVARIPSIDSSVVAAAGLVALGEIGVLWDVETRDDMKRKGIMTTLLDRIMELARRSRFLHVLLDTPHDNEAAIALYESLGFETVGSFDHFFMPD